MEDIKTTLLDLQAALKYCGLDWKMILDDYYECIRNQKGLRHEDFNDFNLERHQVLSPSHDFD